MTNFSRLNPTDDEIEELKSEIDEDQSGEIEFKEFLQIMNSKTLRWDTLYSMRGRALSLRRMQTIDDRESKIRESFQKLEDTTGRISKKSIVSLITVIDCNLWKKSSSVYQTCGSMKLTAEEAEDLCRRAKPDEEGMFTTDDFTKILCNA